MRTIPFRKRHKELFDVAWEQYEQHVKDEFKKFNFFVVECSLWQPVRLNRWTRTRRMIVRYKNNSYTLKFSWSAITFRLDEVNNIAYNVPANNDYVWRHQFRSAEELLYAIQQGRV